MFSFGWKYAFLGTLIGLWIDFSKEIVVILKYKDINLKRRICGVGFYLGVRIMVRGSCCENQWRVVGVVIDRTESVT